MSNRGIENEIVAKQGARELKIEFKNQDGGDGVYLSHPR
jgi:hypothetical protein